MDRDDGVVNLFLDLARNVEVGQLLRGEQNVGIVDATDLNQQSVEG